MKNISRKTGLFIKKNAPQILAGVSAAGVVGTAVMTAKGATKASKLLEVARQEKGEELTKMELVQVAGPAYIPAIALGLITVTSIFGACMINKRRQASLMGGYMMLDQTFKQYRKKVDELYGEGSDQEIIDEITADRLKELEEKGEQKLFFDERSGQFFKSTLYDMQRIEYEMNRDLMMRDYVSVNEWYDHINVDIDPDGDYIGWSPCMLMEMYWQPWLDFSHSRKITDEGVEYISVSFWQEPMNEPNEHYC